jgi:hypothetical protein
MIEQEARQTAVARIGQGGKLHPVIVDKRYGVLFSCHCPGTRQGNAQHKATIFYGIEANCGK